MKTNPLFSIVVTTHHRPSLLERALQSLLQQSFNDFEIVLASDEGSTETKKVAQRLLRDHDVFICLPGSHGPAETRNCAVSLARGRFVMFLDDDDSFLPNYLQDVVNCDRFINDAVNYVSYTKVQESRISGKPQVISTQQEDTGLHEIDSLLVHNFIPNNAIIAPAWMVRRHPIDIRLRSHEDWDFLLSLLHQHSFNFLDISGPVVHINQGSSRNNDSVSSGAVGLDFLSIYRKWPVAEDHIRHARKEMLNRFGLDLPRHLI
jgi:glycosyltransferase involved in cell wall biosynthesis